MDTDQPTNAFVATEVKKAIDDLQDALAALTAADPDAPVTPDLLEQVSDAGHLVAFDVA